MLLIYLLICFLVYGLILLFIYIFYTQIKDSFLVSAPFVPIPYKALKIIVRNLKLDSSSVLYDLGCGDGRVLIEASKTCSGLTCLGVEMAQVPYYLAKIKTKKYPNITILREDFFITDLKNATHIFVYLLPKTLDKLIAHLKKSCMPGTKIVSCDFNFTALKPDGVIELGDTMRIGSKKLFIYTL